MEKNSKMRMRREPWWLIIGILLIFMVSVLRAIRCMAHEFPQMLWFALAAIVVHGILMTFFDIKVMKMKSARKYFLLRSGWRRRVRFVFLVAMMIFLMHEVVGVISKLENRAVTITTAELERMVEENQGLTLENHEELRAGLEEGYYAAASNQEKLKVLVLVAAVEAEHLGIELPGIQAKRLDDNLGGYYDHNENVIVLNVGYLSHEKCSLTTVLHEMHHAYQLACIGEYTLESDLLWSKEVEKWRQEFAAIENDLASNEGLVEYYSQASEIAAREYAKERAELYFAQFF